MITLAKTRKDAINASGEYRAGGTDFQERRRSGVSVGPIVDISRLKKLSSITWQDDGTTKIGALLTIADFGRDEKIKKHYPGLSLPANTIATPQIREMGTMGGVLLQRTRCWYYRHPDFDCYKKGGDGCPARTGNHYFGVCFDLGPCVHPHPSSIGMALLAYDAEVAIQGQGLRTIADLYGDGSDPKHDHQLKEGELLTYIHLPAPVANEKAAYFRLMSRKWAEWPLVEVTARLVVEDNKIRFARVAIGAVATVPLRLPDVENALEGQTATPETLEKAAQLATNGATPLPLTTYKVHMVYASVLETLTQALES